MTVFLINPKDDFLTNAGDRLPMALLQLSAMAKKYNHKTQIFDLNHDDVADVMYKVMGEMPDYVCITISTPTRNQCIKLLKDIKFISPDTKCIVGGAHCISYPEDIELKNNSDYYLSDNSENTFLNIINNTNVDYINSLDDLPIPDYEGIDMSKYKMTIDGKKGAILVFSRNCPFKCAFCGSGQKEYVKPMSPERCMEHVRVLYQYYKVRGFYFADDTFTANKEWTLKFCRLLQNNFKDIVFRCTTRANCLDEKICYALKSAGCKIVSIGLESGDDNVLKAINKLETVKQQKQGVRLCHRFGLKVKGFFIFGLPTATYKTELKTIKMAKDLLWNNDYADAYVFTPYPGTKIWDNPEQFGIEINKRCINWDYCYQVGKNGIPKELQFKHNNLSAEQLNELINKFNSEIKVKGMTS
jgi:radical SAM superfamily enzyme YgiQ (UPF0313 family)